MVKEMFWKCVPTVDSSQSALAPRDYFSGKGAETGVFMGTEQNDAFKEATILFNNVQHFPDRSAKYFRLLQPQRSRGIVGNVGGLDEEYLYSYSFALYPDILQPSGSVNFSRIEKVTLRLKTGTPRPDDRNDTLYIWCINYNQVLVQNGTAVLSYAS